MLQNKFTNDRIGFFIVNSLMVRDEKLFIITVAIATIGLAIVLSLLRQQQVVNISSSNGLTRKMYILQLSLDERSS